MHKNLSLQELSKYAHNSDGFICYYNKTLVVGSGEIKGRLPDDKFIVETKSAKKNIWWS
ncbi:phosphoenolpyruvate carboxykinase (ATP), partial [Francisella tularensis]|uniref:phosphoenolpyruvate carboxykinase (ATP) n=1 Tax=Francisella tularensis TaxID=263 RepID=UPI0023819F43